MMTIDEDAAAAERRWAAAAELADGVSDAGAPGRRTRAVAVLLGLLVLAVIGGLAAALVFLPSGAEGMTRDDFPSAWQLIAQFALLVLGVAVGVGGFTWARRTGHYITRWRMVLSPLRPREQRLARRQIAGKAEPDEHLATVLVAAVQLRRGTLGVAPIYAALILFAASGAVATDILFFKALELVVILLFVVTGVQYAVGYRRAGAFIEKHSLAAGGDATRSSTTSH